MPPDELQRMLEMATSFQENNNPLSNSHQGSGMPNFTPDMLKTATDMMNNIPPEELQNMLSMASSLGGQGSTSTNSVLQSNGSHINKDSNAQGRREKSRIHEDIGESSTSRGVLDLRNAPEPSFPGSSLDMQEQIKNQMNNPAMREMMSTMMKNISPDMMANMSEQFGFKLSREDAESINADEAVAYGAAVLAANLGGIGNEVVRDLILLDVTPLSLGIWKTVDDLSEDDMSVLIPKHTPIPTVKERIYLTNVDNQVTMPIKVYQGESGKTKENILLDSFKLHGIPAAPKHEQKVKVRLNIDANGILEVSAEVISTGKKSTKTTVEPMHVFCDGEQ